MRPFLPLVTFLALVPSAALAQATWTVDTAPQLDVPSATTSGDVTFGAITAAVRLKSGHLVVADGANGALVFLKPDGTVLRRVGRQGSGPGEFQGLWWLGQCAQDSLWTHDLALQRLALFAPDGEYRRQLTLSQPPGQVRCARSGRFALLMVGAPGAPSGGSIRPVATLSTLGSDGTPIPLHASVPAIELALVDGQPTPAPLGRSAVLAIRGEEIVFGSADSAVLERIGFDGKPRGQIRLPGAPRPPTPSEVEAAIRNVLAIAPSAARKFLEPALRRVPPPAQLPAYFGLWVDPKDRLWVLRTPPGSSPTTFTVVSPQGAVIATATSSAGFTPLAVDDAAVIAAREDEQGELHLVVLPLRAK